MQDTQKVAEQSRRHIFDMNLQISYILSQRRRRKTHIQKHLRTYYDELH